MSGDADDTAGRLIGLNAALLCTLTVIVSLTPYAVDAVLPAFPDGRDALGASASEMQLTLTAFLLGVAFGQLAFGALSDRVGRRGPLIAGAAVCAAAAIACALAPSVEILTVARFVQGVAGASGIVLSKAIVRDRTAGRDTVHYLAMTTVGSGALNILAPIIGGLLLAQYGWRGPLWFVAIVATLLLIPILLLVPETHPPHLRERRGRWFGLSSLGTHLRNRGFLTYVAIQSGSYGTLMAYVAASPFVYQNVLGFDGVTYGLLFAVNAAVGVLGNFVANRYFRGLGSRRLVRIGLIGSLVGATATGATALLGAPVWVIAVCVTASMATIGLNGPNLVGLALNEVDRATGSAAATIGFAQFCTGALVAPIVGLVGDRAVLPMVIAMVVLASGSLLLLGGRRHRGIR